MTALRRIDATSLHIVSAPVGPFAMNQYLLVDDKAGAAAIVDSGGDPAPFVAHATAAGASITDLLQTHAHIDHVAGLGATRELVDAPIWLHDDDLPLYQGVTAQARMFGMRLDPLPPPNRSWVDGDIVQVGSIELTVMHTPGHAPGHVCLWAREHGVVFGGDLLFRGSIGRTDLPGSDPRAMVASLQRILTLPDDTLVLPGHMEPTTIGRERRHNPFLRDLEAL